jgi:hypothetical protein
MYHKEFNPNGYNYVEYFDIGMLDQLLYQFLNIVRNIVIIEDLSSL